MGIDIHNLYHQKIGMPLPNLFLGFGGLSPISGGVNPIWLDIIRSVSNHNGDSMITLVQKPCH